MGVNSVAAVPQRGQSRPRTVPSIPVRSVDLVGVDLDGLWNHRTQRPGALGGAERTSVRTPGRTHLSHSRSSRWASMMWPRVALSPGLTTSLAAAALASALSAGLDCLLVLQAGQLSPIEAAAPLDFWGLLMIGGVVCVVVGWIFRYWPGVILAHMLLAGIYCARGVSALVWMVINLRTTGQWHGSSWVSWVVLQSVVHLVLAEAARRQWDKRQLST